MTLQMKKLTLYSRSKNLNKPLPLPSKTKWRVKNFAVKGRVPVQIRSRGFLFDTITSRRDLEVSLTTRGFLVLYITDITGYILHVPSASSVKSKSRVDKRTGQAHMCIKLKFSFGDVFLFPRTEESSTWNSLIQKAMMRVIVKENVSSARTYILRRVRELEELNSEGEKKSEEVKKDSTFVVKTMNQSVQTCIEPDFHPEEPVPSTSGAHQPRHSTPRKSSMRNTSIFSRQNSTTTIGEININDTTSFFPDVSAFVDEDSTHSGLFTDFTCPDTQQVSVRGNPSVSVRCLRDRLQATITEQLKTQKKRKSVSFSEPPKDEQASCTEAPIKQWLRLNQSSTA